MWLSRVDALTNLGLTGQATLEEISAAYKEQALQCNPAGIEATKQKQAAEQFNLITQSFMALKNKYDFLLISQMPESGPEDGKIYIENKNRAAGIKYTLKKADGKVVAGIVRMVFSSEVTTVNIHLLRNDILSHALREGHIPRKLPPVTPFSPSEFFKTLDPFFDDVKSIFEKFVELGLIQGTFSFHIDYFSHLWNHKQKALLTFKDFDDFLFLARISGAIDFLELNFPREYLPALFEALEKNRDIIRVTFPKGYLLGEEKSELEEIIQRNKGEETKTLYFLGGLGFGVGYDCLAILGFATTLGPLLLHAGLGLFIFSAAHVLRERVIKEAQKSYPLEKMNDLPATQIEKQVFLSGQEAKTWGGYFNSFTNWRTYTNYRPFLAGLRSAIEVEAPGEAQKLKVN